MPGKGFAKKGDSAASKAEERRLLTEARGGDPRALRRLLERLSPPIYRFGRSFCRDSDDAQDVMQEVLVSLVRSLPSIRGGSSLTTWAYTVARRACRRQRLRAERNGAGAAGNGGLPVGAEPAAPLSADPANETERRELERALSRAIGELPPAYREAVILRDVEGLSAPEAARVLGVSERALKSRLHRARLALRDVLAPHFGGGARARHAPSCVRTGRLLNRYLDGELNRAACEAMQAHVESCPACGTACRALREALTLCRRPGSRRLNEETREALRRAIRGALEEIGSR
ncbi:MAG TPA: sigma-70 family RNA polymerase sigma factor [Candidatus Eisenbacteria bacterium]|nr:sigma-70 family RNA polymerase sigma factor [Candidatus Eisenbacteria bacterium]